MLAACNLKHRLGAKPDAKSSPGYALSSLSLSKYLGQSISIDSIPHLLFMQAIYIFLHLPLCSPYPHLTSLRSHDRYIGSNFFCFLSLLACFLLEWNPRHKPHDSWSKVMMPVLYIVCFRGSGDSQATPWCGEESLPLDISWPLFTRSKCLADDIHEPRKIESF